MRNQITSLHSNKILQKILHLPDHERVHGAFNVVISRTGESPHAPTSSRTVALFPPVMVLTTSHHPHAHRTLRTHQPRRRPWRGSRRGWGQVSSRLMLGTVMGMLLVEVVQGRADPVMTHEWGGWGETVTCSEWTKHRTSPEGMWDTRRQIVSGKAVVTHFYAVMMMVRRFRGVKVGINFDAFL